MYGFRLVSLRFMSTMTIPKKVALLSAYTKDEKLQAFATRLVSLDWEILASSGTKTFLEGHGVPSTDVATIRHCYSKHFFDDHRAVKSNGAYEVTPE